MFCEGVLIRHGDVSTKDMTSHDEHKSEQRTAANGRQTHRQTDTKSARHE